MKGTLYHPSKHSWLSPRWPLLAKSPLFRLWRCGGGRTRWLDGRSASSRSIAARRALQLHQEKLIYSSPLRMITCNDEASWRTVRRELQQCSRVVGAAGPSSRLCQWMPIVGGVNVRSGVPSGTSSRAPSSVGADGIS